MILYPVNLKESYVFETMHIFLCRLAIIFSIVFPLGRQPDFCGLISPLKIKISKVRLTTVLLWIFMILKQMPYFDSRIETDGQIFKPSTPLNSSFQCAPKVSLSQSYISQFKKRNQTPSAFGEKTAFLNFYNSRTGDHQRAEIQ